MPLKKKLQQSVKALTDPHDVEELGDMDARFSPKRSRVDSDTRGNGTAREVSEKAADAAVMRALVSRNRGLGDPSVQSAQEAAATRHAASLLYELHGILF